MKNWFLLTILLIILGVLITIKLNFYSDVSKELPLEDAEEYGFLYPTQPTLDSIYSEILNLRLDHPNIVFAQVLLETGYLSSELYKNNNNLFGMKISGSRATTSTKIVGGYKWYPNWRESLLDYALLQMSFYRRLSEEEYFKKLSTTYASDHGYINKLKELMK